MLRRIQPSPWLRKPPLKDIPFPERIEGRTGVTFRGGEPALDLFPYEIWARLITTPRPAVVTRIRSLSASCRLLPAAGGHRRTVGHHTRSALYA